MPRTLNRVLESQPIDVVILPMAVADFEPEPAAGKISSERESLVVHCRRTPKVIRLVRDWAPSVYLVGFKLLSHVPVEELIRRAESACLANSRRPHGRQRSGNAPRAGTPFISSGRAARTRRSGLALTLPSAWSRDVLEWAVLTRARKPTRKFGGRPHP